MKTPFQRRRRALVSLLRETKASCLLITCPANWYYLTGFTGESGALLVSQKGTGLVTDGRFMVQAHEEATGIRVRQQKGSLFESVGQYVKDAHFRRVGFDPSQLTVSQLQSVRRVSGGRSKWAPVPGMVEALRMRKDAAEIAQMRKAAILAVEVMQRGIRLLKPGIRELEAAAEIEYQMRKLGASRPAFETIVAFGERATHPNLVSSRLGSTDRSHCSGKERRVLWGCRCSRKTGFEGVPPWPFVCAQHGPWAWARCA